MSTAHRISDRPFLRLYEEQDKNSEPWTVRRVFEQLRWPELRLKKSSSDGQRWLKCWEEFEADLAKHVPRQQISQQAGQSAQRSDGDAQRTTSPLLISEVGSRDLKAFQLWLQERFPLPAGASSINKAVKEIALLLKLAADEGIEVQRVTIPKHHKTQSRPRFYYDDAAIEKLWFAAQQMDWPPRSQQSRSIEGFRGTGMEPADFWRSLIILLRNYGMRVQDLAAYALGKTPILWKDQNSGVFLQSSSPNHESNESWPLGWIFYVASKTRNSSGRKYYLPLTASARAAIDKLQAAAIELDGKIDLSKPIYRIPKSHGLTEQFARLQRLAGVSTKTGDPFQLEDFRKTVATYTAPIHAGLPNALCGWESSKESSVQHKHYQLPEVLLVRQLTRAPLPACFDAWIKPEHIQQINDHLKSL
jgi:hypothetical protein